MDFEGGGGAGLFGGEMEGEEWERGEVDVENGGGWMSSFGF